MTDGSERDGEHRQSPVLLMAMDPGGGSGDSASQSAWASGRGAARYARIDGFVWALRSPQRRPGFGYLSTPAS